MILVYGSTQKCDEYYVIWYKQNVDNASSIINTYINSNLPFLYQVNYDEFKSKKYIGPIKSFESVFSTSITDLLNNTISGRPIVKIESFRTYNPEFNA